MIIFDELGEQKMLDEKLASGGEGSIYPLLSNSKIVVKIYHPEQLANQNRERKLTAQLELRSVHPQLKKLPLAWPEISVYGQDRQWKGYAMKTVNGKRMSFFRNPKLVDKYFPNLTRIKVVDYLLSLLNTAQQLHKAGIYMGDINLDNFLLDPDSSTTYFIDCDSFQIINNGKVYPCTVGQDSMIPPEHQGQKLAEVMRTEESDLFSLTVIAFMMLMSGRHPYEHVGGTSVAGNIAHGHFPYGQSIRPGSQGAIPVGPWYAWWSHLSYNLKGAFISTFTEGASDPNKRIRLPALILLLKQYKYSLENGHLCNALRPDTIKSSQRNSEPGIV